MLSRLDRTSECDGQTDGQKYYINIAHQGLLMLDKNVFSYHWRWRCHTACMSDVADRCCSSANTPHSQSSTPVHCRLPSCVPSCAVSDHFGPVPRRPSITSVPLSDALQPSTLPTPAMFIDYWMIDQQVCPAMKLRRDQNARSRHSLSSWSPQRTSVITVERDLDWWSLSSAFRRSAHIAH